MAGDGHSDGRGPQSIDHGVDLAAGPTDLEPLQILGRGDRPVAVDHAGAVHPRAQDMNVGEILLHVIFVHLPVGGGPPRGHRSQ